MTDERTSEPDSTGADQSVATALRELVVPDHLDGFWAELDLALSRLPIPTGADTSADPSRVHLVRVPAVSPQYANPPKADALVVDLDTSDPGPRRRGRSLLAAVAGIIAVAAVTLTVATQSDRGSTPTAGTPTSAVSVAPSSTAPSNTGPSTTAVSASVAGAQSTADRYMASLASGDITTAASLLGPRSEQYLAASTNGVVPFLTSAKDGLASWSTTADKVVTAVEIRPGDVVVTYIGTRQVEGTTRRDAYALPVRHAESANTWFVEPYAFDAAIGGRMDLLRPEVGADGLRHVGTNGIQVGVAAAGTVYFGDGGIVSVPVTGTSRTAVWMDPFIYDSSLPTPVTVTFVSDTIFVSMAFFVTS
jgi:hypothetical protein